MGHRIVQMGKRPIHNRLAAIHNLKVPGNEKELESFLGAIQGFFELIQRSQLNYLGEHAKIIGCSKKRFKWNN